MELVTIRFSASWRQHRGPGYNAKDIAGVPPSDAEFIIQNNLGELYIPDTEEEKMQTSPKDKMVRKPGVKKAKRQHGVGKGSRSNRAR